MKTLQLVASYLLIIAFFISCSLDGSISNRTQREDLIGTWSLTSFSEDVFISEMSNNEVVNDLSILSKGASINVTLTFIDDGTYITNGTYDIFTEVVTNGNSSEQTETEVVNDRVAIWTLDNSKLQVTNGFIKAGAFHILATASGLSELDVIYASEDSLILTFSFDSLDFIDEEDNSSARGLLTFTRFE